MACAAVPLASAALSAEVLNPWPMTVVSSLAFSWRAIWAQICASSSLLPASATPRQSRTATLAVAIAFGGMLSYFRSVTNLAIFAVTSMISSSLCSESQISDIKWQNDRNFLLRGQPPRTQNRPASPLSARAQEPLAAVGQSEPHPYPVFG